MLYVVFIEERARNASSNMTGLYRFEADSHEAARAKFEKDKKTDRLRPQAQRTGASEWQKHTILYLDLQDGNPPTKFF